MIFHTKYFTIQNENKFLSKHMKGVILAGGSNRQFSSSIKNSSKYLLPVFDKPMIYYSIETLKNSGIRDILIISDAEFISDFVQTLGSGINFGVNFTYKIQNGHGGSAHALTLAKDFSEKENLAVIFADNIFENSFSDSVFYFQKGAQIFTKKTENPSRFGIVETRSDESVRSIEEKPDFPKSNLAQTGFFLFDNQLFDFIEQVTPSKKGQLEITEVLHLYLEKNELKNSEISDMWICIKSPEDLLEASILTQESSSSASKTKPLRPSKKTKDPSKITIGVLTHNSENYVKSCLNSLLTQDYENVELIILDNNSIDKTVSLLKSEFPQVKLIESNENLGFGSGHNEILRQTDNEFYACLNIDMIFEPNFLSELVKKITENSAYGSVGGKIKRWNFSNFKKQSNDKSEMGKTNFIDSIGLRILRSHRFEDIGQGEVDYGQFDHEKSVFGISGAAALFRKKALEDVAFKNLENGKTEYFDESMFLYKEDVDLAYRLQWAGWKSQYTPNAIGFHDRTTNSLGRRTLDILKNRPKKSSKINGWSFLSHQILLKKNFSNSFSINVRKATFWYNFKVFIYLLFLETETLFQLHKMIKLRKKIKAQKKSMPKRISQREIEKFMES